MKRVLISIFLLLLSFSICAASTVTIKKDAAAIQTQLQEMLGLLQENDLSAAREKAESCRKAWEDSDLPFFIYLDHESFSEISYLIPTLTAFTQFDRQTAAEQILRCHGILQALIESQDVRLGNIL